MPSRTSYSSGYRTTTTDSNQSRAHPCTEQNFTLRWTGAGARRWTIRFDTGLAPDITVAVRMADCNEKPLDYYLLPLADIDGGRIRLTEENGFLLDSFRFDTLDFFFSMAARFSFTEMAA